MKKSIRDKEQDAFREEVQSIVADKLDQINHYISGIDSPFSFGQIREVQELMLEIRGTLGIKVEEDV